MLSGLIINDTGDIPSTEWATAFPREGTTPVCGRTKQYPRVRGCAMVGLRAPSPAICRCTARLHGLP